MKILDEMTEMPDYTAIQPHDISTRTLLNDDCENGNGDDGD